MTNPHDDTVNLDEVKVIDGEVIDGEVIDATAVNAVPVPDPAAASDVVDAEVLEDETTARLEALGGSMSGAAAAELGPELTAALHSLAAEAGNPPAALGSTVATAARRVRRRRYALTAAAALVVLAVPATAVATRQWSNPSTGTDRLVAAAPQTADSLTIGEATSLPAPVPSKIATASPKASASTPPAAVLGAVETRSSVSAGVTVGSAPVPAPPVKQGPPPAPLSVSLASVSNSAPKVGDEVTYTVNWQDGDGRFSAVNGEWGEGEPSGSAAVIERCNQVPSPGRGNASLTHAWATPGRHTVTISVSTYDCTSYTLETRAVTLTVTVQAAPTMAPPTSRPTSPPSATPAPGVG